MTGNGNNIGFNFGNFFKTMMPPFFPMMNQNFLSIYTVINQIGLPPIVMGNPNFAHSVWGYTQMNSYGDQFICHAGTPGSSTKELSEEDKLIAEDQKKLKEETTRENKYAVAVERQNFESIKELLTSYVESIKTKDTKTLGAKKYNLIQDFDKYSKTYNTENYKKLLQLYNAHAENIKSFKVAEIDKKQISTNNTDYATVVKAINDDKIDDIIENDEFKPITVNGKESDFDIMEFMSTWNDDNSSIITLIGEKRKDAKNKENHDEISNALHNALLNKANSIDTENLSTDTKDALEKAIEEFNKFSSLDERYPDSQTDDNYENAFNNLYKAIRLAEAEKLDSELEKSFDFLDNDNPYKNTTKYRDLTNTDLKEEKGLNSEPNNDETVNTEKAEKASKNEETQKTKRSVTVNDQTYYVETDNNNYVTAVYNSKRQKINLSISIKNALPIQYKEKFARAYEASKIAEDLYLNLKGAFSDDEKTVELLNKINKDNVLDVIGEFNTLNSGDYNKDGIIEWLRDDEINQEGCFLIIKALLLKAEELNLQDSNEFKNLIKTAEVDNNNNEYKIKNPKWTYSTTKAEKIDDCIRALIKKIKAAQNNTKAT